MYGTVFNMKVKPGQESRVAEHFEAWNREIGPNVEGAIGGYLLKPDNKPDELIAVAMFRDEESYRANAERPEQDAWFRQLRELLTDDPEWQDGEYLAGTWTA